MKRSVVVRLLCREGMGWGCVITKGLLCGVDVRKA